MVGGSGRPPSRLVVAIFRGHDGGELFTLLLVSLVLAPVVGPAEKGAIATSGVSFWMILISSALWSVAVSGVFLVNAGSAWVSGSCNFESFAWCHFS